MSVCDADAPISLARGAKPRSKFEFSETLLCKLVEPIECVTERPGTLDMFPCQGAGCVNANPTLLIKNSTSLHRASKVGVPEGASPAAEKLSTWCYKHNRFLEDSGHGDEVSLLKETGPATQKCPARWLMLNNSTEESLFLCCCGPARSYHHHRAGKAFSQPPAALFSLY